MELPINTIEARVLGCLIEKELATPEYYPLTLNALTSACNQKSNRDPVMTLDEADVVRALDALRFKRLAHQSAEGVRAARYCHNLEGLLRLEPQELAILAELLLRGPQTVGELRGRAERMAPLADLPAVEEALAHLAEREIPLVMRLPRQPGRKEQRYAHLLCGVPEIGEDVVAPVEPARARVMAENERLTVLETEVAALRAELGELRTQLAAFRAQFE
ncbi:MAG: DUF480 domain-containing protein [Deltaproteobacteria bacterium]|nr:MAG: DUF480 domain-containing protein [Deltaproteobacteria bacterium]